MEATFIWDSGRSDGNLCTPHRTQQCILCAHQSWIPSVQSTDAEYSSSETDPTSKPRTCQKYIDGAAKLLVFYGYRLPETQTPVSDRWPQARASQANVSWCRLICPPRPRNSRQETCIPEEGDLARCFKGSRGGVDFSTTYWEQRLSIRQRCWETCAFRNEKWKHLHMDQRTIPEHEILRDTWSRAVPPCWEAFRRADC